MRRLAAATFRRKSWQTLACAEVFHWTIYGKSSALLTWFLTASTSATIHFSRWPRENHFDWLSPVFVCVPLAECPTAMDGMERFACPIPDRQGRYRCIDDHVLCDGFIDCPDGEDEDRRSCMFYKTVSSAHNTAYTWCHCLNAIFLVFLSLQTKAHLDVLADALLRWARGR